MASQAKPVSDETPEEPEPSVPGALSADDIPPGMLLPMRQKMTVLAGIMATLFLAALDQTVVSVALPRIVADLGGLDLFVWPFTAYMLTSTAVVPVVGKMSDVYGRKPLILAGISVFLLGSVLSGVASSMEQLIGFRAVQGLGAGLIMTNAFTAIGDLFAPRERGRWMGLFGGVFAVASILGPLLGGTLTDELSWRWIFYINVPVGAVAFAIVAFGMPWFRQTKRSDVDYLGGALLVLTAVPLLLGLSWAGNQYGWADPQVLVTLGIAAGALVLFLLRTRRIADPILPLHLFRNRVYTVSILATAVLGIGMFGVIQFLPLFLQGAQGVTATNSGLVTMPMVGGLVVGSVLTGQMLSRGHGVRGLTLLGGVSLVSGLFLLSTLDAHSSRMVTRGFMVLVGLGMGFWMPIFNLAVQNALPHSQLGVGTASLQFFRQLGGTLAVAIFGGLLVSNFNTSLAQVIPLEFSALLDDPQFLLSPERLAAFTETVEAQAPGTSAAVVASARAALASSITDLFVIGAVVAAIGLFIGLFLPRVRMLSREDLMQRMQAPGAADPAQAEAGDAEMADAPVALLAEAETGGNGQESSSGRPGEPLDSDTTPDG